ncbi:odorant receptor 30a-like isoform X2 [Cylas formicarius]|uniref:odorant receptor 30a-like isoform X2 n=1 Tax=Cylas formicarius TaxID=197179 RepID=UPI0029585A14|nr:odorant receptor 30a-like isoform X2 [Cylas formicarius]
MNSTGIYFRYIRWLMIATGMWKIEEEFSISKKRFYAVYCVIIQLIFISLIFSVALEVPALLKSDSAAVGNIGMMVFLGTVITKMLMCQSKPVVELLRFALQSEFHLAARASTDVETIYKFHTKLNNNFITLLITCILFMGLYVATIGDYNCYKYFKQNYNTTDKPLFLNYWYPFDRNKYYVLVLVDQNIRPTLGGLYAAIVNAFVNSIILFVRLQLKLLQYSFRNFGQFGSNEHDTSPNILKMLCVKHQELIRYVGELNDHLNVIIFMEYMVLSITFAGQILQITAGIEPFIASVLLTYTIIQLLMFAWNCNEIIIQSTELAKALFESKWYDYDTKIIVIAHIMMMRCQKPLSLMIGRFGVMDLDVGISRLKLAYSYASVMTNGDK